MCGIAGMIDWKGINEGQRPIFVNMQQKLHRRGPDQNGLYIGGVAALIHARLSVVDIANGVQPMRLCLGDEEYILVYNGELYNTQELRDILHGAGHIFKGHSDTEVLLHSYVHWGEACVEHLNGIFAFAVWEKNAQRLFLARDRIGVKPLFYALRGSSLIFASEIKALLAHPDITPTINTQSIAEIMLLGPGRTPGYGVFCGIEEIEPATCGYYTAGGLNLRKYWSVQDRIHNDTFEQTVEHVRYLVTDAIKRQLVADVPVGTFLSGGLDSSIISAVADREFSASGRQLHTFSVEYRDNSKFFETSKFQPSSDEAYIALMNKALNARHHKIVLDTDDLVNALYTAVDARDLPGMADIDASLLLFCEQVKSHVTVALSGECADEIFGGYPWYRDKKILSAYGFPWAQSTDYRASFLLPEIAGEIDAHKYVDDRYQSTLKSCPILKDTSEDEKRMKEMVNLNLTWFMQTLLDRKDRMSMYNGLEVRVPFCDYRIAEYLYSVPWEMKDYKNTEKGLLRMAMQDLLSDEVLWRKKSPYPKTHNPAYLKAVSIRLQDEVLSDSASPLLQIVSRRSLEALLKADNSVPWYGQLMTTPQTIAYFLQINYWLKSRNIQIAV